MTEAAFQSEELALSEEERICADNLRRTPGTTTPSASELIASLRKNGRDQAILEVALALPLEEYRRVEEVFREVDPPRGPSIRRRR